MATAASIPERPGRDDGSPSVGDSGLEREQIELDICRLLAEAKPEACILVVATIALFITAGTQLLIPAIFGNVVNAIANKEQDKLRDNAIVLVVVTVASAVFAFLRGFLFNCTGQRVVARLRNKLFHAIMQQEVAFFDSNRTGELVSRLGSDVTILKDAVTTNISMFLRSSATVLGGIAYLFVLNWRLALVLMGIVPLTAITAAVYGRYVRNLSKSTRKALAQATEVAEESLGAIRTVRSFAGEGRQEAAYGERIAETLALGIKTALAYGVFSGGMQGVTTLAFTGIVWYGGTLVLQGSLSVGTLTAFLLYAVQIGASLAMLSGLFGNLMQAVGANDRVFQILA
ncbi:ABCB25, partial [Symbiodinium sp. KB8]